MDQTIWLEGIICFNWAILFFLTQIRIRMHCILSTSFFRKIDLSLGGIKKNGKCGFGKYKQEIWRYPGC